MPSYLFDILHDHSTSQVFPHSRLGLHFSGYALDNTWCRASTLHTYLQQCMMKYHSQKIVDCFSTFSFFAYSEWYPSTCCICALYQYLGVVATHELGHSYLWLIELSGYLLKYHLLWNHYSKLCLKKDLLTFFMLINSHLKMQLITFWC